MISDTLRNLLNGLKLVLLVSSVRSDEFRPSLMSSSLLVAIGVATLALIGYAEQDGQIYFNDFGAVFLGTALLVAIVGAIAITRLHGSLDRLPDLLTILAAGFPWVAAALSVLRLNLASVTVPDIYWQLALVWCISIVVRAIYLTFSSVSALTYLSSAAVVAGLAFGAFQKGYAPALFFSYDESEYEQYASLDKEDVFLSQSRLLGEELDQIISGRPDMTDVYFVGFAGNGEESVFASEATFVQDRVAEEFLTEGRSLVLSNDFENVRSKPLANTHNLFQAISHVGEKMDVDDDVLFLFLTSHGSKDASIQVSLFPLQLKQLTVEDLRVALDDAQIEWRVIVVSACYSGSFIEPLMTDRTIIMTASAAEKTSFGCSNDRDLTYFGEAFFRDSFGDGSNLLETFEQAKALIRERETLEGLSPSEPQLYVGSEIVEKLSEFSIRQSSADH